MANEIKSFDGLKFFAALIIVLFHIRYMFPYFHQGYFAVELFFIMSGFLLAKTHKEITSFSQTGTSVQLCKTYFFHRFIRLWPEFLFVVILSICLSYIISINAQPFFLNIFMMAGWAKIHVILAPMWFVCVLFWCECLLYNLLILEKEKSKAIFFPLIAILCLFCLANNRGNFGSYGDFSVGYLTKGNIRGLLALIIGIYTYLGCKMIESSKINWRPRFVTIALFIGEVVSVIGLGYIFIWQRKFSFNIFNGYFYISFLIGLLYFQKEKLLKFLSWKIWFPFGTISYSIFLVHILVINCFNRFFKPWTRSHVFEASVSIILLSIILAFFCHYSVKIVSKVLKKVMFKK